MFSPYFETRDAERADVRTACAALDGAIGHLLRPASPSSTTEDKELRVLWAELVQLLVKSRALEPARELRECPICGATGMRAATRCCRCWTRLPVQPNRVPSARVPSARTSQ